MPTSLAARTYAIPRSVITDGEIWENNGGQIVVWQNNVLDPQAWFMGFRITVPTGSIGSQGFVPAIGQSSHIINVPTGSMSFNGQQPTYLGSYKINVPVGSFGFYGAIPGNGSTKIFNVPTGSIVGAGQAPHGVRGTIIGVPTGTATFAGKQVGGWRVSWTRLKIK